MIITLDVSEFQIKTILKALNNEADRDRAYKKVGVADTLNLVMEQIEAALAPVKKPVQRETTERKKLTGSR